jgi:hypothetical protein
MAEDHVGHRRIRPVSIEQGHLLQEDMARVLTPVEEQWLRIMARGMTHSPIQGVIHRLHEVEPH